MCQGSALPHTLVVIQNKIEQGSPILVRFEFVRAAAQLGPAGWQLLLRPYGCSRRTRRRREIAGWLASPTTELVVWAVERLSSGEGGGIKSNMIGGRGGGNQLLL